MRCSQPIATLPLFISFALLASQALAADFTGRVVGVADGDIITVLQVKGKAVKNHHEERLAEWDRVEAASGLSLRRLLHLASCVSL